jgi:nucleoside-diphosphate-sugar epimerase
VKVFLTGGTSLIGRTVAQLLVDRGDDVTCFQRGATTAGTAQIRGDVRDRDAVASAARGHDAIIHLAAMVGPSLLPAAAYHVNVIGARNVAEVANDVGRLVHISSPSVAFDNHPAVGEGAGAAGYRGSDSYAWTKAFGEQVVLSTTRVPTVVLRPHLVWGPGDTQLVGRIIDRARQGRLVLPDHGHALIDSTFITDAATAIVAGLDRTGDRPSAWGVPWVVTGNDPRPLAELIEGIVRAAGLDIVARSIPAPLAGLLGRVLERTWRGDEPPLTYFAARQLCVAHWFDQRATQDALSWRPAFSVDEGLEQLASSLADSP